MRSRPSLTWLALVVFGCGSRTGLSVFERASGVAGESTGGQSLVGGRSASGGNARGGAAGAHGGVAGTASGGTSAHGGVAGTPSGGVAGTPSGGAAVGGALGGEPNAGGFGEGGSGGKPPEPSLPVELALGAFTTCVRFDDGSVRCWGTRSYIGSGNDQTIGDDETPDVLPPVAIGDRVSQISNGWYHTCAVLQSGNLRCFGDGHYGMLGYGSTEKIGDDEAPASAGDVSVGGKVRQVSVGAEHTCALLENAKLRCWGHNDHFQLGFADGASIGDDESPASAGFVDVGAPVLQVAASVFHTCALIEGNNVRCWGTGGRLGYGNNETIGDDETIESAGNVDIGGKVVQLAAGMQHTCALLDTGNVRCWGLADQGRLGYGNDQNIGDDETPADAGDVDIGGKVVQIAADAYGTCALLDSGSVRCWGSGQFGELGYGNTEDIGDDETPASAGDVPLGAKATRIDVGFLHACAILETGAVRCWGRAAPGCLGYGNVDDIGDDETPASAGDVKLQ